MDKPLVSICIPTYNRASVLERTLESIVCQQELLDGRVEVIISDNASTDNTEEVGKFYSEKYTYVHYYKNKSNVGDENFPIALSKATGVLRKLNNDTFCLKKDALKKLCVVAEEYADKKPVIFLTNGRHKIHNNKLVNYREFIASETYWITWLAAYTAWDTECDGVGDDLECADLHLWQVDKVLKHANVKNSVVLCDYTLGKTLPVKRKDVSYGIYQVFYNNFLFILRKYTERLQKSDVDHVRKSLLYGFFTNSIISWELYNARSVYSETENLKKIVFEEYENEPYWNDYLKYYKKRYYITKVKRFIKKILGKE